MQLEKRKYRGRDGKMRQAKKNSVRFSCHLGRRRRMVLFARDRASQIFRSRLESCGEAELSARARLDKIAQGGVRKHLPRSEQNE